MQAPEDEHGGQQGREEAVEQDQGEEHEGPDEELEDREKYCKWLNHKGSHYGGGKKADVGDCVHT